MGTDKNSHRRDFLANERTFLSWVRLGIAISALGFVIARFGLFLSELTSIRHVSATTSRLSAPLGTALILFGPSIVLFAGRRYFQIEHEIETGVYRSHNLMIYLVLALAVLVGVLLAIDILST